MSADGPRIEVIVDPKGVTKTTTFGLQGGACRLATAGYEARFGEVLETEATADAYEDPHEVEIKSQQGGGGCGG